MKSAENEVTTQRMQPAASENSEKGVSIKPPPYSLDLPKPNLDAIMKSNKNAPVPLSKDLQKSNEYAQKNGIAPDLSNYKQQKISQVSIGSIVQRLNIVNSEINKCYKTVFRQVAATGPTGGGATSKGDGANLAMTHINVEKLKKYKAQLLQDLEAAKAAGQTH